METISTIEPLELPPDLNYELDQFRDGEARKFYVQQRRKSCTFMEIMDLWLVVPMCLGGCALEESLNWDCPPLHPCQKLARVELKTMLV